MSLNDEKTVSARVGENALSDDELGSITGGGRSGGGSHSKPEALYSMGELLRIRAYDGNPNIIRVRGGKVDKMQYKSSTWQYQLDTGWGYSTDWYKEEELGPWQS